MIGGGRWWLGGGSLVIGGRRTGGLRELSYRPKDKGDGWTGGSNV